MNTNQYTQKTLEALQAAQQLAVEYQHNAMEPEHLLHALATQEQLDAYSAYTDTYGANYCTMVAMMDTVTEALTTGAKVA